MPYTNTSIIENHQSSAPNINDSSYCPDCNSCGTEGCCNADDCKYLFNHPNCKTHLDHLLLTYKCNKQLLAYIYKQGDMYKELIKEWEEIWYNTSER